MKLVSNDQFEYVPATFVKVSERLHLMDRRLGYFGRERFVFFYYEPRGEEVIWNDGRSYGFASGGWAAFMHEVSRIGKRYGVNIGTQGIANTHVLMLDREEQSAYFAQEWEAESFIRLHRQSVAA
jgi:hypothetical protein